MGLLFGSSLKMKDFQDIDVLLVYSPSQTKEIKKIQEEIRVSGLVEKPLRYVEISEKDILRNRKNKIFYHILSDSLVFHNSEKYVEVIQKCQKLMNTLNGA